MIATRQHIEQEYEAAQRSLLGDPGWLIAKEFEYTRMVRDEVAGVAGAAVLAGVPLTPQQAEELTRLIADNARQRRTDVPWIDTEAIDREEVDTRAAVILSQPHLELLRIMIQAPVRLMAPLHRALDTTQ